MPRLSNHLLDSILLILVGALWAVWIQPHTVAARNLILISGSLLGLYSLYRSRDRIWPMRRLHLGLWSIGSVVALLLWIIVHYLFLSRNPTLQWEELSSIWKRVAIALPFALGAGLALARQVGRVQTGLAASSGNWALGMMACGFILPTGLYLLRYAITQWDSPGLWPDAFLILPPPSSWYIPKTGYVFFCLPILALAIADLLRYAPLRAPIERGIVLRMLIDFLVIVAVLSVFLLENIKNGILYSAVLMGLCLIIWFRRYWQVFRMSRLQRARPQFVAPLLFVAIGIFFVVMVQNHLEKNESWTTLMADAKIAWQTDQIDHWKYQGQKGYPENEFGRTVSITNYERIAWAKVGSGFVTDYPLGYGLVLESFRHIGKEMYPDSRLLQSHSGWLDLTLGLGIPGSGLILLAGLFALTALWRLQKEGDDFARYPRWFLFSLLLCMLTTEVAQKVYIDALLFTIVLVSSYSIARYSHWPKI